MHDVADGARRALRRQFRQPAFEPNAFVVGAELGEQRNRAQGVRPSRTNIAACQGQVGTGTQAFGFDQDRARCTGSQDGSFNKLPGAEDVPTSRSRDSSQSQGIGATSRIGETFKVIGSSQCGRLGHRRVATSQRDLGATDQGDRNKP